MGETVPSVLMLAGHEGCVCSTAFLSDGVLNVTAFEDCTVRIWSSTDDECMWTLTGHEETVLLRVLVQWRFGRDGVVRLHHRDLGFHGRRVPFDSCRAQG